MKMNITNDIRYVGVNDHKIDLFEGQYDVPNGMALLFSIWNLTTAPIS